MVRWLILATVLVGAGCRHSGSTPARDRVQEALTELGERVAPGLPGAAALRFEARALEGGRVVGLVPSGWEPGLAKGAWRPPSGRDLGFATRLHLGTNCAGACEARDWAAVFLERERSRFGAAGPAREERLQNPPGLAAVGQFDGKTLILVGRWQTGWDRYCVCRVELGPEALRFQRDFEGACRAMRCLVAR